MSLRPFSLALRGFWSALLCGALLTCVYVRTAQADDAGGNVEQAVKAAYLYKFLGYVQWPPGSFPQPGAPFVIGIAAGDAMLEAMANVAARHKVQGRALIVRRVSPGDSLADIHLLYIDRDQSGRQQLLMRARQWPILTVTESDDPISTGIINFRVVDNRVRFDIALGAARSSGLDLSSRLLSVALAVQNEGGR